MNSSTASHLRSYRKQNLLLEFAALKYVAPLGVYAALTPGDASKWSGVLFVRKGPYSPAILRFSISFPAFYPAVPPVLVFSSDLFHPLMAPLSMYSYASATPDSDMATVNIDEPLPPGGFSLRHGFPDWFSAGMLGSAHESVSVVDIFRYVRSTFESDAVLDIIPLDAAANTSAWYAWKSHRGIGKPSTADSPPPNPKMHTSRKLSREKNSAQTTVSRPRQPSEWKWEGVWEDRVKKALQANVSDPAVFGNSGIRDEDFHFLKLNPEQIGEIKAEVQQKVGNVSGAL